MMGYWGFGPMTGFFPLFFLACVAVVALLVWAAFQLVRPGEPDGRAALEILRRRFASGEITEAEYEQARRRLG